MKNAAMLAAMEVPRGVNLVAALAVSATALSIAYGFSKRKAIVDVVRGKGPSTSEYHRDGDVGEDRFKILPWVANAMQRLQRVQPGLVRQASGSGAELLSRSLSLEGSCKERLVRCDNSLVSSEVKEQQMKLSQDDAKHLIVVSSAGSVSPSALASRENSTGESDDCEPLEIVTSPASGANTLSPAVKSSSASSRQPTLVGCIVRPGSLKVTKKAIKVVRFSPSVVEPSTDSRDYRRRVAAEIAAKAALQKNQTPQVTASPVHSSPSPPIPIRASPPSPPIPIRSVVNDRQRPYSQYGRISGTLSYNSHRYRGCRF